MVMASQCEKCQGEAAPAAQMRTFEFEGQILHCLVFVSSCVICGRRWKVEMHEALNSHHVEEACAVANRRQQTAHDARALLHRTDASCSRNHNGEQGSADSRRPDACADGAWPQPTG
jgi:hypothetical protein